MIPQTKQELDQLITFMKSKGASNQAMRNVVDDFTKRTMPTVSRTLDIAKRTMSTTPEQREIQQLQQTPEYEAALKYTGSPEKAREALKEKPILPELGKGLLKDIGSTVMDISETGQKLLAGVTPGVTYEDMQKEMEGIPEKLRKKLEYSNTPQQIGGIIGEILQYAIPGAKIAKGAKAFSAAKKFKTGTKIATQALTEGLGTAGITTVKGGTPAEIATTGALGAILPVAGAGISKVFKPTRLMEKALGLTDAQSTKVNTLIENVKDAKGIPYYKNLGDFALKNNFKGTRTGMKEMAEDIFENARKSKADILKNIPAKVDNKYGELLTVLESKYNVPGQSENLQFLRSVSKKAKLTAEELEKVRYLADSSLPRGAYTGAEPVSTKGMENMIDEIRTTLGEIDKTGVYKKANADIRILYKLVGTGQNAGFLTKAAEKNLLMSLLGRGTFTTVAATGAGAINPVLGGIVGAVGGIENALLNIPIVSSTLARVLNKIPETQATEIIKQLLEGAFKSGTAGVTKKISED